MRLKIARSCALPPFKWSKDFASGVFSMCFYDGLGWISISGILGKVHFRHKGGREQCGSARNLHALRTARLKLHKATRKLHYGHSCWLQRVASFYLVAMPPPSRDPSNSGTLWTTRGSILLSCTLGHWEAPLQALRQRGGPTVELKVKIVRLKTLLWICIFRGSHNVFELVIAHKSHTFEQCGLKWELLTFQQQP